MTSSEGPLDHPARDLILQLNRLTVLLGGRRRFLARDTSPVRAVDDVSLDVIRGEILGVIGESGCGKTTLGRTILGLQPETSGRILLNAEEVSGLTPQQARETRRAIQYVHQDAGAAFDPWWSFGSTLEETLIIHDISGAAERRKRVDDVLAAVGLDSATRYRYPHELSGGQLRRMALARILILQPQLVILDEPTSGLDMSLQAVVLNLLLRLRRQLELTYVFISHDLSVVRRFCDRVAIMYLGRIVEFAATDTIFARPTHPYTKMLLAAAPSLEPPNEDRATASSGEPPYSAMKEAGCSFAPRCEHCLSECLNEAPLLQEVTQGHAVACGRWRDFEATPHPRNPKVEDRLRMMEDRNG